MLFRSLYSLFLIATYVDSALGCNLLTMSSVIPSLNTLLNCSKISVTFQPQDVFALAESIDLTECTSKKLKADCDSAISKFVAENVSPKLGELASRVKSHTDETCPCIAKYSSGLGGCIPVIDQFSNYCKVFNEKSNKTTESHAECSKAVEKYCNSSHRSFSEVIHCAVVNII